MFLYFYTVCTPFPGQPCRPHSVKVQLTDNGQGTVKVFDPRTVTYSADHNLDKGSTAKILSKAWRQASRIFTWN